MITMMKMMMMMITLHLISGDDSSACRDKYYCAAALARGKPDV